MTTIAQGSLVIVGANTDTPEVFWNGAKVDGIIGINVDNDADRRKVVLTVQEVGTLAELKLAGIAIKREV